MSINHESAQTDLLADYTLLDSISVNAIFALEIFCMNSINLSNKWFADKNSYLFRFYQIIYI